MFKNKKGEKPSIVIATPEEKRLMLAKERALSSIEQHEEVIYFERMMLEKIEERIKQINGH